MPATETNTRPTTKTLTTYAGRSYVVRKVETYTVPYYRNDGGYVEPETVREENAYIRQGLPCIIATATHTTLSSERRNDDGSREKIILVRKEIRGDYALVEEFLSEQNPTSLTSLRDGSGMLQTFALTPDND